MADAEAVMEVGPVLEGSELGREVAEVIQALNPGARVSDQGAYLRISVRRRCVLTRAAVESRIGRPFRLPGDLEIMMPSFKGKLEISESAATWNAPARFGT